MKLSELKKLREESFLAHKKKKKAYYLKNKAKKARTEINYEEELNDINFAAKIKEIAKVQKKHVDSRIELIQAKLDEYKDRKKEYYEENKERRLEYDKEYREKKKEELKAYRREYYQKNKDKILEKQRLKRQKKSQNEEL